MGAQFLKRTKDGLLIYCSGNKSFQLLFKNINLNLTQNEFDSFAQYIYAIDENFWEQEYCNSVYNKKIPIPSEQANLLILLDRLDLFELRKLLNYQVRDTQMISCKEIDYTIMLN